MSIRLLNCNSSLEKIILNEKDGSDRQYLLNNGSAKKLDLQVSFSDAMIKQGYECFIEVKFKSKYSDRERRIEIVSKKENKIALYKISKFSRFDKDAIDLSRLLDEIKEKFCGNTHLFFGVLLYTEKVDEDFLTSQLKNMNIDIGVKQIQNGVLVE